MTCRTCQSDCNQGRDCPHRVQRRIPFMPVLGGALIVTAGLWLLSWGI